jgi:hypothetical protein
MTFLGLTIGQTLLLAAVSTLAVFLLHWLRARPVERPVATTMFWRPVAVRLRPRYLWQRLRAPLSLILTLLVTALLLLALCGPFRFATMKSTAQVVVIEAGPALHAPGADGRTGVAVAIELARELLEEADPRAACAIVVADPVPRLIAPWDTPRATLAEKLSVLRPAAAPVDRARILRFLDQLAGWAGTPFATTWCTADAAGLESVLERAGADQMITVLPVSRQAGNGAILWAAFVPQPIWSTRGALLVRVGWYGAQAAELVLHAGLPTGERIAAREIRLAPGAERDVELATLDADGRAIELTLVESLGSPVDNRTTIHLPNRPPISARVPSPIPDSLRIALEAVPVELRTDGTAAFWVATDSTVSGETRGPGMLIVETGPRVDQPLGLDETHVSPVAPGRNWDSARCGVGSALEPAESMLPILRAGVQVLAALDRSDPERPRLLLADALLAADSTAPRAAAFPAFVAAGARLLAGVDSALPVISSARLAADPSGVLHLAKDTRTMRTYGDRDASRALRVRTTDSDLQSGAATWVLPSTLALMCGLLLIGIEGHLWARGWIR